MARDGRHQPVRQTPPLEVWNEDANLKLRLDLDRRRILGPAAALDKWNRRLGKRPVYFILQFVTD